MGGRRKTTSWRDVPLLPAALIASQLGDVPVRDVHAAQQLASLLPDAPSVLELSAQRRAALEDLARPLARDASLHTLRLARCCLDSAALLGLSGGLASNRGLQVLDLSGNRNASDAWRELARALQGNLALRELVARDCGLEGDAGIALGEMLCKNSSLRRMDLAGNARLGDRGGGALAAALARNGGLRSLQLRDCGLGPFAAHALAYSLHENTTLTSLDISINPKIGDAAAAAVAAAGGCLDRLLLLRCGAASDTIDALLQTTTALGDLAVSSHAPIDQRALARMLRRAGPLLRRLELHSSDLAAGETTVALAEAVSCGKLRHLDVAGCRFMAAEGLASLYDAVRESRVETLDLSACEMPQEAQAALLRAVREAPRLQKLCLAGNEMPDGCGWDELLEAAARKLSALDVSGCGLGAQGVAAIAKGLRGGTSALRSLDVARNVKVDMEAWEELVESVARAPAMEWLGADGCAVPSGLLNLPGSSGPGTCGASLAHGNTMA